MAWVKDPALGELRNLQKLLIGKSNDDPIKQGIDRAIQLFKDRDDYCEYMSSEPSQTLKSLAKSTLDHPFEEAYRAGETKWKLKPTMMTGFLEGNFLQSLVSMSKANRVLEIGMFTGYAALACAEVVPENGTVVTCEYDPYLEKVARMYFDSTPHGRKIHIRIAPAQHTLMELIKEKQQFDFVFIDANKDGYAEYFQIIMENNLLSMNGTIVFDNALMSGVPYLNDVDPASVDPMGLDIKICNEFLKKQPDIHRVLVPIRDGVLIVRRLTDMYRSV